MCGMLWYNEPGTEDMMTSSNGNIFRVTGPLCEEFTGPGEFPTQRPVTRSFDVFYDQRLNKRLSKQPWGWWFESSWRQCYGYRSKPRSPLTVTAMCWPYVYTDWVNPLPAEGLALGSVHGVIIYSADYARLGGVVKAVPREIISIGYQPDHLGR